MKSAQPAQPAQPASQRRNMSRKQKRKNNQAKIFCKENDHFIQHMNVDAITSQFGITDVTPQTMIWISNDKLSCKECDIMKLERDNADRAQKEVIALEKKEIAEKQVRTIRHIFRAQPIAERTSVIVHGVYFVWDFEENDRPFIVCASFKGFVIDVTAERDNETNNVIANVAVQLWPRPDIHFADVTPLLCSSDEYLLLEYGPDRRYVVNLSTHHLSSDNDPPVIVCGTKCKESKGCKENCTKHTIDELELFSI